MSTFLSILFGVLLLFVGGWTLVMGGIGWLLGPRRGRTRFRGFVYGVLLGPIGWALLCTARDPYGRGRAWTAGVLDRAPRPARARSPLAQERPIVEPTESWEARDELRY